MRKALPKTPPSSSDEEAAVEGGQEFPPEFDFRMAIKDVHNGLTALQRSGHVDLTGAVDEYGGQLARLEVAGPKSDKVFANYLLMARELLSQVSAEQTVLKEQEEQKERVRQQERVLMEQRKLEQEEEERRLQLEEEERQKLKQQEAPQPSEDILDSILGSLSQVVEESAEEVKKREAAANLARWKHEAEMEKREQQAMEERAMNLRKEAELLAAKNNKVTLLIVRV